MILCAAVLGIVVILAVTAWTGWWKPGKRVWETAGVLGVAAALGVLSGISGMQEQTILSEKGLKRKDAGEGNYRKEMELTVDGLLLQYSYPVEVPEQRMTDREEEVYLAAAKEEITAEFPGKNVSANEIREQVLIRESYQNGRVQAEWSFDSYEIMDFTGKVVAEELPDDGELVQAFVRLECGTSDDSMEFVFRVLPPQLDEKERFLRMLKKELNEQREKKGTECFMLPQNVGGYAVRWKERKEYLPEKIFFSGCAIAFLLPCLKRSRKQEWKKKREQKLMMEYPDMVSKLTLLLGAGMTVKRAFGRIAVSYEEKRRKQITGLCFACEEMLITCREIESGVGEERAYERFGERCGLESYRKLGNLLARNLRKGGNAMIVLLEKEVENAFEDRKSAAKRYGEEAGTKLLFPMMLMLGMIMVILVVPAVLAFQM